MERLREFKRKLDAIQRKRLEGERAAPCAAPGAPSAAAAVPHAPRRFSPFLDSVLTRASELRSPPPAARALPVLLEEECPGAVTEVPAVGKAYVMLRAEQEWAERGEELRRALRGPGSSLRERLLRRTGLEGIEPEELLFLDIETTGLGSTPLFLIGLLAYEGGKPTVRQLLARDYAEEAAVLRLFLGSLGGRRLLVSFNGKSFDLPYIKVRLAYHRAPEVPELAHFDVLHEARRIWRDGVPNCRLTTLEQAICGRVREGDIDGAQIPDAYHRYVRSGDGREMVQIIRHNRFDLLTMAELMLRMPAS